MTVSADGDTGQCALAITDGATAAVSNADELRFRYNDSLNRGEYSQDGGAYQPFGAGVPLSGVYTCPAGVSINDAVTVTGNDAVDEADADDASKRPCRGFVFSKPTATSCILQYTGEFAGFVGMTANALYYLAETPGTITSTKPTSSGTIQQIVGWARNTTTLVIDIEQDFISVP